MNKISCNVIQDLLPLYMDQVVSEDSRILVEEHLKECQKCRTCLSEMGAEVPISYDEEQREKARQELKNFQKFLSRKKRKIVVLSVVLVLAVVTALVIFLNQTVISIKFEEAGIEILEEDREKVTYRTNIPGNYTWVTEYSRETGTMVVSFEQSLWERYISGLFRPFDQIQIILKKDIIKEIYQDRDGTQSLIWEATPQEKERYFAQDLNQPLG